jgi:hypothetical protein
MSYSSAVPIPAYYPITVVISKQERKSGARRIDREMKRPIGVPPEAMINSLAVYIVSFRLV